MKTNIEHAVIETSNHDVAANSEANGNKHGMSDWKRAIKQKCEAKARQYLAEHPKTKYYVASGYPAMMESEYFTPDPTFSSLIAYTDNEIKRIKELDPTITKGYCMVIAVGDLNSIDYTDNMTQKKKSVKLSKIASFETAPSPVAIRHQDQSRTVSVKGVVDENYITSEVAAEVEKAVNSYEPPAGYTIELNGENEATQEAIQQVLLMMVLAVLLMYLIMVAQFQGLLSPFIIMFTIPLAFTGGFIGLWVSGSEVISMIGFVMLSGIIVNNGIVLVDYTNQLRTIGQGMEKREAIVEAGRTRLRPILMTAITTVLGLIPMVVGKQMGSDMSRPMAIVVIGGLVYGTLLTLFVVPCMYDLFARKKMRSQAETEALEEQISDSELKRIEMSGFRDSQVLKSAENTEMLETPETTETPEIGEENDV